MQISQKFPQFEDRIALIVVAGKHECDFYIANKGVIEKVRSFSVEKPSYEDREGFFARSGLGRFFGSGSVYEAKDEKIFQEFSNNFHESIKALEANYSVDEIYAFLAVYVVNEFQSMLPAQWRDKIKKTFRGNYLKKHPFDLLKMMQKK